jgi:hypothetical protein
VDVTGYAPAVRIVLAKLLLLIAVLLMPLGMTPAEAGGHPPDAMASMAIGHCDPQAPKRGPGHGITQCTMACSAALPAAGFALDTPVPTASTPVRPTAAATPDGLHPHPATPPPKDS